MDSTSVWAFAVQASLIGLGAALSPGPFQSLVIAQALLGGWRRALPVTLAPLLADIPVAVAMVLLVQQVPTTFLLVIRIAGALLLLYLAWDLARQLRKASTAQAGKLPAPVSAWRSLLQGMLMLFLGPGTYLFWGLVLGPLLVEAAELSWVHALAFLAGFYIVSIAGLLLIAYIFEKVGQYNPRLRRGLQLSSLLLMLGMALWLGIEGIGAWLAA
ncbi:MAG: LysE family transporter [Anaerolineales bacterium]|nr:LysE family transporter [Anaerolineales bacterium]MBX3004645.1 LysE family transporter [Anaerolineales bacterium]MCW5838515.1 LysE family transporter [Anaerolineales bacterium]